VDNLVEGLSIGLGFDQHSLTPNRTLILGGVPIPYDKGLLGHSDGDVLLHALMDALLGALGEPDIGTLFPSDNPEFKGVSSINLLERVARVLENRQARILNLDMVMIAQNPKLAPYKKAMEDTIAAVLAIPVGRFGLKVKHPEGIGAIGRGEGMMAQAVALLWRP
jgi:2-C-methyl-D-erythritol 2,4-cyclodiphosphate synthase